MASIHPRAENQTFATLKPDLEASGERRLAEMEIAALLGAGSLLQKGSKRLHLPKLSRAQAELLTRRLAFTDHLTVGERQVPCEQATLERCYTDLLDLNGQTISGATRKRNEYLTHGFHKYKAKFFPRMARSLINITCGVDGVVLDPFAGSGTTLIEAVMMGIGAVGVDIDPLAAFITHQKLSFLSAADVVALGDRLVRALPNRRFLQQQGRLFTVGRTNKLAYRLPSYIRTKLADAVAADIEAEVDALAGTIHALDDPLIRNAGKLALSHSIATKINLRWMGTGDNRFSLTVTKSSIISIFVQHVRAMARALRRAGMMLPCVDLSRCQAVEGSAVCLPIADESIDGIVTSPPYLPASSGRETYLRSRGPSIIALNLLSEQQLLERETRMMGSILNLQERQELPATICDLVEWMIPQRARAPKAHATATYFNELRASLCEMARVLKPGGKIALVVATVHTFYHLVSRETVRTLDMPASILALLQIGVPLPLKHVETVEIELAKMDFAARPAARGKYSESIVVLEKTHDRPSGGRR